MLFWNCRAGLGLKKLQGSEGKSACCQSDDLSLIFGIPYGKRSGPISASHSLTSTRPAPWHVPRIFPKHTISQSNNLWKWVYKVSLKLSQNPWVDRFEGETYSKLKTIQSIQSWKLVQCLRNYWGKILRRGNLCVLLFSSHY